jgi:hypothetical protein
MYGGWGMCECVGRWAWGKESGEEEREKGGPFLSDICLSFHLWRGKKGKEPFFFLLTLLTRSTSLVIPRLDNDNESSTGRLVSLAFLFFSNRTRTHARSRESLLRELLQRQTSKRVEQESSSTQNRNSDECVNAARMYIRIVSAEKWYLSLSSVLSSSPSYRLSSHPSSHHPVFPSFHPLPPSKTLNRKNQTKKRIQESKERVSKISAAKRREQSEHYCSPSQSNLNAKEQQRGDVEVPCRAMRCLCAASPWQEVRAFPPSKLRCR